MLESRMKAWLGREIVYILLAAFSDFDHSKAYCTAFYKFSFGCTRYPNCKIWAWIFPRNYYIDWISLLLKSKCLKCFFEPVAVSLRKPDSKCSWKLKYSTCKWRFQRFWIIHTKNQYFSTILCALMKSPRTVDQDHTSCLHDFIVSNGGVLCVHDTLFLIFDYNLHLDVDIVAELLMYMLS